MGGVGESDGREVFTSADGTLRLRHCPEGRSVSLWFPPNAAGEYVLEERFDPVLTREIRRRPGETIRLRIGGLADATTVGVSATRGALRVEAKKTDEPSVFEIRGLPPGRWTVRVTTKTGTDAAVTQEVDAIAGTTVDVAAPSAAR